MSEGLTLVLPAVATLEMEGLASVNLRFLWDKWRHSSNVTCRLYDSPFRVCSVYDSVLPAVSGSGVICPDDTGSDCRGRVPVDFSFQLSLCPSLTMGKQE